MQHIGIGIVSLLLYIGAIILFNMVLKRKMGEAMMWSCILLWIVGVFFGGKGPVKFGTDGIMYAISQEVVYAGLAFVFMAYIMERTGIIGRLVNILNAFLGRLPGGAGYVATIGCALFGMVSGVASANTAAIGSVTIPWMKQTGWSKERAACVVAGNSGLGNVFPPSTTMLLFLAFDSVAKELNGSQLYIGLMSVGIVALIIRLGVVWYFAKKEGLKGLPSDQIQPISKALKENGSALILFLGVALPLLATMGPTGEIVKAMMAPIKGGFKSISLILWIPMLITFFSILEGWKSLPHNLKGWHEMCKSTIDRFNELGAILIFAFVSSRMLTKLNLTKEFVAVFQEIANYSPMLVIFSIAIILTIMVGPFNSTATTTAMGAACYAALRTIGLPPVACAVAFINLVSNQGCVPPNSAPIYIGCGIAGVEEPTKLFKELVYFYALPEVILSILVMMQVLPVAGA